MHCILGLLHWCMCVATCVCHILSLLPSLPPPSPSLCLSLSFSYHLAGYEQFHLFRLDPALCFKALVGEEPPGSRKKKKSKPPSTKGTGEEEEEEEEMELELSGEESDDESAPSTPGLSFRLPNSRKWVYTCIYCEPNFETFVCLNFCCYCCAGLRILRLTHQVVFLLSQVLPIDSRVLSPYLHVPSSITPLPPSLPLSCPSLCCRHVCVAHTGGCKHSCSQTGQCVGQATEEGGTETSSSHKSKTCKV